nr:nectin-3-like protein isoform X1 [Paramormyrops kingsleyae]
MGLTLVLLSLVLTSLPLYTTGNVPHVISYPHVDADLGGDFTMNCRLSLSNTKVSQVQWSWRSSEKPEEIIVVFDKRFGTKYLSPKFGGRVTFFNHSQHHVSIRVSDVMMNDTGNYTCQYTTFPSGIFQATTTVTVTAHPLILLGVMVGGVVLCLGVGAVAACIALQKKRRIQRDTPSCRQSDAYENVMEADFRPSALIDVQPVSSDSDHIYTGLLFSDTSTYSILNKP